MPDDDTTELITCPDCGATLDGYWHTDRHQQRTLILTCRTEHCGLQDVTRELNWWLHGTECERESYRIINHKARERRIGSKAQS
jgi:hypothetical protein